VIFLDTNTVSYAMRSRVASVEAALLRAHEAGEVCISAIVYSELKFGLAMSSHPVQHARIATEISRVMTLLTVVDWDTTAADALAVMRAQLRRSGNVIGAYDMAIAAHALSRDALLVTNNEREFSRVPGLKIENWT
jgi:tRNA(fMet)-specific endonuclease VapC